MLLQSHLPTWEHQGHSDLLRTSLFYKWYKSPRGTICFSFAVLRKKSSTRKKSKIELLVSLDSGDRKLSIAVEKIDPAHIVPSKNDKKKSLNWHFQPKARNLGWSTS
uniref:Uncharacterized protein n=1 Tax=Cacopsylla melanoneura TaxID=428564 RepID=A0A8D8RQP5_9HEMI